jgi:hypothetical protein
MRKSDDFISRETIAHLNAVYAEQMLSAGPAPEIHGASKLVGSGSMVGPRAASAEVRAAAAMAVKMTEAIQRLADEEGITFLECLRRIAELPDERQPRPNISNN